MNIRNNEISQTVKPIIYNPDIPLVKQIIKTDHIGIPGISEIVIFAPLSINGTIFHIGLGRNLDLNENGDGYIKITFHINDESGSTLQECSVNDADRIVREMYISTQSLENLAEDSSDHTYKSPRP